MADPKPKSSTVAKVGASTGTLATVLLIWQAISPMLSGFGVPKDTVDKINSVVQVVEENSDKIQQLWDLVHKQSPAPAPSPTPLPSPVVPPDIQALQDQIKLLTDLINRQNVPPPPTPVPTPAPAPQPAPLPSAIKAIDSQGKPITGSVDPGQMFFIQATTSGGTWTVIKSVDTDVDAKVYADEVSCVLRNEATVTVVHSSGQPITTSALIVKCNKGAQPPPVVNPNDMTPVTPIVKPTKNLASVVLIYSTGSTGEPPFLAKIIGSHSWWANTYGSKWQFLTSGTKSPKGVQALQMAQSKGLSPPFLAVWTDGDKLLDVKPVPQTIDQIPTVVNGVLQ